jgi:cytochrome c oxidase subunit IV
MNDSPEIPKVLSYRLLITVLAMLLLLTGMTIGISMIHLGKFNVWAALLIASVKSSLVILFFMHMKYENRVIKIAFVSTICFVAILIGFIFWDIVYR